MPHIFLSLFLIFCFTSCTQNNSEKHTRSYTWHLVDSLLLESAKQDTIFYAWPYIQDKRVFLFSPLTLNAFEFDQSGKMIQVYGKGSGQGPGEFISLDAIVLMGDQTGLFDGQQHKLHLFDRQGELVNVLHFSNTASPDDEHVFYANAFKRELAYGNKSIFSYVHPETVNHDDPRFYQLPFLAKYDHTGKMKKIFGKRPPIYSKKNLAYQPEAWISYDPFEKHLIVSLSASPQLDVYDTNGVWLEAFGQTGKYIEDQEFPNYPFPMGYTTQKGRKALVRLMFEAPEYGNPVLTEQYIMRTYRRGIPLSDNLFNFMDKPHFAQIYNRHKQLLWDGPLPPSITFIHTGVQNKFWVSPPNAYDAEHYRYKLFLFELRLAE